MNPDELKAFDKRVVDHFVEWDVAGKFARVCLYAVIIELALLYPTRQSTHIALYWGVGFLSVALILYTIQRYHARHLRALAIEEQLGQFKSRQHDLLEIAEHGLHTSVFRSVTEHRAKMGVLNAETRKLIMQIRLLETQRKPKKAVRKPRKVLVSR